MWYFGNGLSSLTHLSIRDFIVHIKKLRLKDIKITCPSSQGFGDARSWILLTGTQQTVAHKPNLSCRLFSYWWSFLEHSSACLLMSVTVFPPQWQSWVVGTKTVWPVKPQVFSLWPFLEEVCLLPWFPFASVTHDPKQRLKTTHVLSYSKFTVLGVRCHKWLLLG